MLDKIYNNTEADVWYKIGDRPEVLAVIKKEIASTPVNKQVPFELSTDEKMFRRVPKDLFEALKNDADTEIKKREWVGDRGRTCVAIELYQKGQLLAIK